MLDSTQAKLEDEYPNLRDDEVDRRAAVEMCGDWLGEPYSTCTNRGGRLFRPRVAWRVRWKSAFTHVRYH